jgi:hypothetical protein
VFLILAWPPAGAWGLRWHHGFRHPAATDLAAVPGDSVIELSWVNPARRVDNTVLRIWPGPRSAPSSPVGEPKWRCAAEVIAGCEEIATVRLAAPAGTIDGGASFSRPGTDRWTPLHMRRAGGGRTGRLSPPSARLPTVYIAAPAPPTRLEA